MEHAFIVEGVVMTHIDVLNSRRGVLACLVAAAAASVIGPMSARAQDVDAGAMRAWINTVAVSADGQFLAVAGSNKSIVIFEIASGQRVRTLDWPASQNGVGALAFSDDGRVLFAGNQQRRRRSQGKAILAFQVEDGALIYEAAVEPNWVARFASSVEAEVMATIGQGFDRSVRLWRKDSLAVERIWPAHESAVMTLAMSPDGRLIATGGGNTHRGAKDPTIKIWDVATGGQLHKLSADGDAAHTLGFTADGRRLVAVCMAAVSVWDVNSGALAWTTKLPVASFAEVVLSPDTTWFAMSEHKTDDKHEVLAVRAVDSGKILQQWTFPWQSSNVLAVSPDGQLLFAGGFDSEVRALDVKSGALLRTFKQTAVPAKAR
jgi:WD40 repeat protein